MDYLKTYTYVLTPTVLVQATININPQNDNGRYKSIVEQNVSNEIKKVNRKISVALQRAAEREDMNDFLHLHFRSERGVLALHYLLLSGLVENRVDHLKHVRNFLRILLDLDDAPEEPADGGARRWQKHRQKMLESSKED